MKGIGALSSSFILSCILLLVFCCSQMSTVSAQNCDQPNWWVWNDGTFKNWVRSPDKWPCARAMMYAQWDVQRLNIANWFYNFPPDGITTLKNAGSRLWTFAESLVLLRPQCCTISDENCSVVENYYIPQPDWGLPPVCSRSYCYFHPSSWCTNWMQVWNNLPDSSKQFIYNGNSGGRMNNLISYLQGQSSGARPVGTWCKGVDWLRNNNIRCPLRDCTWKQKRDGDETEETGQQLTDGNEKKRELKDILLQLFRQQRQQKTTRRSGGEVVLNNRFNKRQSYCPSNNFSCSNCQESWAIGTENTCVGQDKWGGWMCCYCSLYVPSYW